MIPATSTATETDHLPGREIAFSIGDPRWVMKTLTKLYSNTILATIREYSTNARDAHIEAGKADLPIKVTLPTLYHPFFEVEDFGVGMSPKTMETTYTEYGTSTKRESAGTNGMLGYGSKSALAYTESFTVESVRDGFRTVAAVSRKADYSVVMKVIDDLCGPTDKPNGTKIQVPSRDHDAFRQVAIDFYRFWMPGTVEVDGEEPEWAVGEKLDDNLYYSTNHGTSYVVMGNVGYRIANPDALFRNKGMNAISFVAYVPDSSVEFTPSREDLEYTDLTKATLHGVVDNFEKKMVTQAKSEIAKAANHAEAYAKYTYWTGKVGKKPFGDLEYKGDKFEDSFDINGYRYQPSETRYNMYHIKQWHVAQMKNSMIVTGLSGMPNSNHKARAKKYRTEIADVHAPYILFTPQTTIDSVWVDQSRVFSWDTIKDATKPPKKPRDSHHTPRVKGTFDYETKDGCQWEKELPDTSELYYITVADDKVYGVREVLRHFDSKGVVVRLAVNRVNKFVRDNPHAKSFVDTFKDKVNLNGIDFLDAETKEALAVGMDTRHWLNALDVNKIDDPEFKRLKRLINADTNKALERYNAAYNLAVAMRMRYNFKEHHISKDNDRLLDKYPLMKSMRPRWGLGREVINEYVFYINAKFAAANKKGK